MVTVGRAFASQMGAVSMYVYIYIYTVNMVITKDQKKKICLSQRIKKKKEIV